MKKYVNIVKNDHEIEVNVTDELPEFKTAMPVGVDMSGKQQCYLILEDENALAELLNAFVCVVAKENVKVGKKVLKGIAKTVKESLNKLKQKGEEEEKKDE